MRALEKLRCCLGPVRRPLGPVRHQSGVSGRRVVVTGTGLITCLGVGTQHVWDKLINGECGITQLTGEEYAKIPSKVAGRVARGPGEGELTLEDHVSRADRRTMSDSTCFGLIAAAEALKEAGWAPQTEDQRCYTGVAVGTGMAGIEDFVSLGSSFKEHGYGKLSPLMLPKILGNMPAGQISIKGGFKGPNHAVTTACTTGAHAIGDAFRFIKYGDAEVMVCGSTEASVVPFAVAAFARIRALCTNYNDRPKEASRPFDADRSGFVMGEGTGILVLEELQHAQARGATILAEVLGYGLSADANHITAPSETGEGALRSMRAALRDAGLQPTDIGYVNAHATSTPLGDAAESRALTQLLGNHRSKVGISSTKGALGHLQGGAGSVEAIVTVKACQEGIMPPTLNCHKSDEEFDLNYVPLEAQKWQGSGRRVAITNSFGFGGTNASLCIGSWEGS